MFLTRSLVMKYLSFFVLVWFGKIKAQEYEILQHLYPIKIVQLSQLNSPERECNLSILPNSQSLYFMTTRDLRGGTGGNGDVYVSHFENSSWQEPHSLESINTLSGEDEPTFSKDGSEMYYQSWAGDWKSLGGPYYRAEFRNGNWVKKGSMGSNINMFFALQSSANLGYGTDGMAVSPDGNLFIVACGPDYNGPMDLYYSQKTKQGWTFPELMSISTYGDERSVFIAADNRTLYFSSDGMGGMGGLDIFKVRIEDNGKLGKPVNIGEPFNTPEDDMGFVASADGKSAFFIRNLDIYFADISALSENIKPILPRTEDTVLQLPPVVKNSPHPDPPIQQETLRVYFDHDIFSLNPDQLIKIQGFSSKNQKIHLHGYCDSDGSISYNLKLARRRCETVKSELIKQGVDANVIQIHVHGEADPAETNSSDEGKARNRRVEIN